MQQLPSQIVLGPFFGAILDGMNVPALRFVLACLLITGITAVSGCGIILGEIDTDRETAPALTINFVETLRNQESLRGESYREQLSGMTSSSSLQRPSAVYADEYRVYVADIYLNPPTISSARIFVFDRTSATASVLKINSFSVRNEGKLLAPSGIAVDQGMVIFVSDPQLGKVFGYDRNGAVLTILGQSLWGASRNGYGELTSPVAVAIDTKRSRIYVADSRAVKAFNTSGAYLFQIQGGGGKDFRSPVAVAVDKDGNVIVLDGIRRRVSIFDQEGGFISSFSMKTASSGRTIKPAGIAVDSDGHVYVTDTFNNCVFIFQKDGTLLSTWGKTGLLTGDFWTPAGIFIDERDFIYIADQTNGRVQTFRYLKQVQETVQTP